MTQNELLKLLRLYLIDSDSEIFTDDELKGYLTRACDAYSRDTEMFRRRMDFKPDGDGKYRYPPDFIKFVCCFNCRHDDVVFSVRPQVPWKGEFPVAVYDESTEYGCYGLSPDCTEAQGYTETEFDDGPYGIVLKDDGLLGSVRWYGFLEDSSYGVETGLGSYEFVGDYVYARVANAEEIDDYNALLYHALYEAYGGDSEWADTDKSRFYKALYDSRVARGVQMNYRNSGRGGHGHWF